MRVVVIGGTGHIGSFLVPMLCADGHEVVVLSRGRRTPYVDHEAWRTVQQISCDRPAEESAGTFGARVADLAADVIMDLTCFTPDSARQLVQALDGQQLVHTGSIWAYGRSLVVPVTEDSPKKPYGEYGVNKAAIEHYLLHDQQRLPATVLHPGHITGPGWVPINPAGNLDLGVYQSLITDGTAVLPDRGMELLQHVHAEDVAAIHLAAMRQPDQATGQSFNAVAEQSLTLRGYAELVAAQYGHEPQLEFVPWSKFAEQIGERNAAATADHIGRSPHCSMAKARQLLGFRPNHTAWQSVREAIGWLVDDGRLRR